MKRVYANLLGNWTDITETGKIHGSDAGTYVKEELQDMFKYDYVNVEYGGKKLQDTSVRYPSRYGINSVSSILDSRSPGANLILFACASNARSTLSRRAHHSRREKPFSREVICWAFWREV